MLLLGLLLNTMDNELAAVLDHNEAFKVLTKGPKLQTNMRNIWHTIRPVYIVRMSSTFEENSESCSKYFAFSQAGSLLCIDDTNLITMYGCIDSDMKTWMIKLLRDFFRSDSDPNVLEKRGIGNINLCAALKMPRDYEKVYMSGVLNYLRGAIASRNVCETNLETVKEELKTTKAELKSNTIALDTTLSLLGESTIECNGVKKRLEDVTKILKDACS